MDFYIFIHLNIFIQFSILKIFCIFSIILNNNTLLISIVETTACFLIKELQKRKYGNASFCKNSLKGKFLH